MDGQDGHLDFHTAPELLKLSFSLSLSLSISSMLVYVHRDRKDY